MNEMVVQLLATRHTITRCRTCRFECLTGLLALHGMVLVQHGMLA